MIPDYNHNGKIDKYDREMEEIFLEEDEQIRKAQKRDETAEGWAFIIVLAIIVILGIKLGIH